MILLLAIRVFLLATGANLIALDPRGPGSFIGSALLGLFVAALTWGDE